MPFDPARDLELLPHAPGVYLMRDHEGTVVYVGKAADLKNRVKQYFGATSDTRAFVSLLGDLLDRIDVILTINEKEALILEAQLIKLHRPRFNVLLKDDKSFLHIRLDEKVDWPRLEVVRKPQKDGARYFGPFHSSWKLRETLHLIERHFQLRTCDDLTFKNRARPCLQYQIHRCPGPCVLPVDREGYGQNVKDVALFLKGGQDELLDRLKADMKAAAQELAYERAARIRDQIRAIEVSLTPQEVVTLVQRELDRDVVGLYREGSHLQVVVLLIRRGRMVGTRAFTFEEQGTVDEELLSSFVNLFYNTGNDPPDEVLVPVEPLGVEALAERLSELKGRKVEVRVPMRGSGRRLGEMARINAEQAFFQGRRSESVRDSALIRMKDKFRLSNLPVRIECFDISLFQGGSPVASQVVFEGGVPARSAYRHYKIRTVEGTDDFAMMREVLTRRLKRGMELGELPDLIVVDGGKGQLGVALAVVEDLKICGVDLVGLAKARLLDASGEASVRSPERVFLPNVREPIVLKPHTDEFFLLTRLRDEAHRFAITFHRKLRQKRTLVSALDGVPGLGPERRRRLLRAFGSVSRLKEATVKELKEVEGMGEHLARVVFAALHPEGADDVYEE